MAAEEVDAIDHTVAVVHDDGSVGVMDADEYVKGVLPYEMATGWPMEALKAQNDGRESSTPEVRL